MAMRQFQGMELTPEQQLGYVFEQFTNDDENEPGRVVAIERGIQHILGALEYRNGNGGGGIWKRLAYDVAKQALGTGAAALLLFLLTLIALGFKVQIATGATP
jgi:hypothetical protein